MSSFVPASPVGRPAGLDTLQPRAPSLVEYPVVLLGISLMCHYAATIGSLLTLTKVIGEGDRGGHTSRSERVHPRPCR